MKISSACAISSPAGPQLAAHLAFGGQLDDGAPRHALEQPAIRRGERAALHHEDVEAGPSVTVPSAAADRHGGVAVIGLEDALGEIEPVEVLDPLVERFRRMRCVPARIMRSPSRRCRSSAIQTKGWAKA